MNREQVERVAMYLYAKERKVPTKDRQKVMDLWKASESVEVRTVFRKRARAAIRGVNWARWW